MNYKNYQVDLEHTVSEKQYKELIIKSYNIIKVQFNTYEGTGIWSIILLGTDVSPSYGGELCKAGLYVIYDKHFLPTGPENHTSPDHWHFLLYGLEFVDKESVKWNGTEGNIHRMDLRFEDIRDIGKLRW